MKRKVNISILCIVLIFCCILGAIPASAKLETLKFSSDGSDAELGTLAVNEKIDIDFAGVPDSFYSKWTDTD